MKRFACTIALGLLVTGSWGCGSTAGPPSSGPIEIALAVTGGVAGVDWQYTVDGALGRIVGDRCAGSVGCDWAAGQIIATFEPAELDDLVQQFFQRDFFEGPGDYGSECCDQFDYVLSYREEDFERSIRGSDGTIPDNVRSLILLVQQFVDDARG